MILVRRLKSSAHVKSSTWMVLRMSRPAKTACVRPGDISRAAMGMPVLCWVFLSEDVGLRGWSVGDF